MECRGCEKEVGEEGKNGLCLACNEQLDRWVYEQIAKELIAQDQEIEAEVEALRKSGKVGVG